MQLGNIHSFFFVMINAEKFRRFPLQALEADPTNPYAQLSRALYLFNAPEIVGGDPKQSLTMLSELSGNSEGALQFHSLAWLGQAYQKQGQTKAARSAYLRALKIVPGSKLVKGLLAEQ